MWWYFEWQHLPNRQYFCQLLNSSQFYPRHCVGNQCGCFNHRCGSGSVSPNTQQVNKGETLTLTLSPAAGFRIGSVSGCNGVLTANQYTTGKPNGTAQLALIVSGHGMDSG
ncbi:hypothetical protein [Alishewanella longhuensis]